MQRLRFNEMSDVIVEKFDETKYKNFSRLCVDTAKGTVKQYSIEEANDKIRKTIIEMAGLSETPTPNEVRKAFKKYGIKIGKFDPVMEVLFQPSYQESDFSGKCEKQAAAAIMKLDLQTIMNARQNILKYVKG